MAANSRGWQGRPIARKRSQTGLKHGQSIPTACDALTLRQLEAYDLFPFTEHAESLALFERT